MTTECLDDLDRAHVSLEKALRMSYLWEWSRAARMALLDAKFAVEEAQRKAQAALDYREAEITMAERAL